MEKRKAEKGSDRKQIESFRQAARELGCDESEDRFRDALRAVAKHKPQPAPRKK
jgi:hypothetical protein